MAKLTTVDIARNLADALETSGIEYAIGGALALGYTPHPAPLRFEIAGRLI